MCHLPSTIHGAGAEMAQKRSKPLTIRSAPSLEEGGKQREHKFLECAKCLSRGHPSCTNKKGGRTVQEGSLMRLWLTWLNQWVPRSPSEWSLPTGLTACWFCFCRTHLMGYISKSKTLLNHDIGTTSQRDARLEFSLLLILHPQLASP